MSTEPSREHVEALAVAYHEIRCDGGRHCAGVTRVERHVAKALLSSSHPAVLDAMQDALVRAGRLTGEWSYGVPALDDEPGQYPAASQQEAEGPHEAKFTHGNPIVVWRRYATEWQEVFA